MWPRAPALCRVYDQRQNLPPAGTDPRVSPRHRPAAPVFFVSFLEKCFARRLTSENLSKNLVNVKSKCENFIIYFFKGRQRTLGTPFRQSDSQGLCGDSCSSNLRHSEPVSVSHLQSLCLSGISAESCGLDFRLNRAPMNCTGDSSRTSCEVRCTV